MRVAGMKGFLVKRWFLLLMVAGIALTVLLPASLQWTVVLEPRAVVAPALFLAALGLESRHLFRSMVRPWPALWATVVSYAFLPAAAWLVGRLLPHVDYQVGLMISASVPCTLASAVIWTRLAGGNEATALLVILLTTCTSWLVTTAWLTFGTGTQVTVNSADMMRDLLLTLVVPVIVAQAVRAIAFLARLATRYKTALGVVARLLILAIILKAALQVRGRIASAPSVGAIVAVGALCLGTHLAALAAGFWSSKGLGFDRPSQIAVAFAGSQKTLPVALFLFDAYFKDYPLAVLPLVFYHVGQLVVDTFIADAWAGKQVDPTELPDEAAP